MISLQNAAQNLRKNNMKAYVLQNRDEVLDIVKALVPAGAKVGAGGSVTLSECGITDFLRNGDFVFYDRKPGMTAEELEQIFVLEKQTDIFFSGSNAITEAGELYNVDGRANRVAAIAHGPKQVVVIAGKNKIVKDIPAAVERVKKTAAPKNCVRLSCKTPCAQTGHCISIDQKRPFAADGCESPDRICCHYLISGFQRVKDRITVILVNEDLGY